MSGAGPRGRREVLGLGLAGAVWAATGCSAGGRGDGGTTGPSTTTTSPAATGPAPTGSVPTGSAPTIRPGPTDAATMRGWIEEVVAQGVRRPAYPADGWTQRFVTDAFRALGLEDVHAEPVPVMRWEPKDWSLEVTPAGGPTRQVACFPLPHAAPTAGLEAELARFDPETPESPGVAGRAALVDARLVRLPADAVARFGSAPDDRDRVHDPDGELAGEEHVLPHTAGRNRIVEPVVEAGAAAFVGTLLGYPGDGHRYYVPYHGEALPIPGVWISGSEGERLHAELARGPVTIRLVVASTREPAETATIVGDLPGQDDELVLVGSHHDGPWASAVEDGTGIALVLAQAAHWAAVPQEERPHRLRFVLHGAHMDGGAGHDAYIETHADELDSVVLAVHLEHAALDVEDRGGELIATGRCVPRWFFTSLIPPLEAAVIDALRSNDLRRSLLVAPDALGANPPTDGAHLHSLGVPIVQLLGAPWYLFDEVDTLDKVDVDALVPLTRATADLVGWTAGRSATAVRAEHRPG